MDKNTKNSQKIIYTRNKSSRLNLTFMRVLVFFDCFWWWTRLGPESMSRRHQNSRLVMNFVLIVTRTRITSSTRHLESVLALTRHLIRLLAVRINSRVGDKNTLSWCLCSIKIEHAYTSHPLDTLVSDMHALTTVSEGEGSVCAIK